MLQLYDLNKVKISNLTLYKDLKIQSVLSTGDKTLSFSYPSRHSGEIKEEGYIRTKTHEFVIKEISTNGDWKSIKAVLNVEDLEGKSWEHFDTSNQTITECLTLALAGTGWTIGYCNETKKRTIRKTSCSTWDIIQEIKKAYFVEMEFDTLNKRINIAKKLGNDKGVYFMDSLNLKDLDIKSNSYDFCTRLIAIGKDDLKVIVENYQYSSKNKTIIWKDEKYTDENSLREDAIAKLEELSKPYKSYGADIVDLASINNKYSILSYGLGDIITLISKEECIKEKQRIVKMVEYPDEPDKNTCEIANTILTFEDMQKEYEDTSKTVNNITSSNGTISEGAIKGTVEKITINKADIKNLNAVEARVGDLETTRATITQLDAANANISKLQADKADITELNAGVGRIDILESNVGDIQTLVNGNLTSNNIQSLILSSDKVTVANGFIKNAMIENLDASKINAGDISTNKFRIKSDNGGVEIVGATQQFKDKNNRVRIQMGQDALGNFNFILRGEDGTTTLIDHTGIKENAIGDDLIKSNMISENAVGGKQIDYNSFTEEFNADTNTSTLKSSKVLLDETGQTLNVVFNTLNNTVDGVKTITESNTTALNVQQGKIDSLISNTTIVKDGQTIQLKDSYNSTVATVNSISNVISEHTSTIDGLTGQISEVETKTNNIRRDLDGTIEIISKTTTTANSALYKASEAQKTADGFSQRVSTIETDYATTQAMNSAITQSSKAIKLEVSKDFVSKDDAILTYATKASMELTESQLRLDFYSTEITNLLSNSSFSNRETTGWNMSGIGLYTGNDKVFMPTDGWRAFSLTSDRGLLYQNAMVKDRLPKRNTKYTFSLSSITEGNIETFRLYIDYKLGANYVSNHLINLKTGYNIDRYSVTFTTRDIDYDTFLVYIEVKPKTGTAGYRVFSIGLPCLSKGENGSYTARQNEIISGSTEIDANGVTIHNGAIDIKNKVGTSVLKGDANGNLMVRGNLYADPAKPILHLFGGCSIDATASMEQGVGSAVRFKWDEKNYLYISTNKTDIYQNGISKYTFNPSAFVVTDADIGINGGFLSIGGKINRGWGFSSGNTYWFGISGDDKYVRMYNDDVTVANGVSYLGSPSGRFIKLYTTQAVDVSSDIRRKTNILAYDDKIESFYDKLKPVSYELIKGHSGRKHYGFIAQEVEDAMNQVGLNYKDMALLQKAPMDAEGNEIDPTTIVDYSADERIVDYEYSLAYTEMISINTHMIQKLRAEITQLKNEISEIKGLG